MSVPSKGEERKSVLSKAASGSPTLRKLEIDKKKDVLGVCLIVKRTSSGSYEAVCSGSVVKDLLDYSDCIFIITSDNIVSKKDLAELQGGSKTLNTRDYKLYFKTWNSDSKLRSYELHEVTRMQSTNCKVKFTSGLALIPLDAKKLGKRSVLSGRSGLLTYRPFHAKKDGCSSGSLICQVVDGNVGHFDVMSYKLGHVCGEYVLTSEREDTFKTLTEITGRGSNNRHPCGAVILRTRENQKSEAVGALDFKDDKISPVFFNVFGECIYMF